jgi:hypothetical protein
VTGVLQWRGDRFSRVDQPKMFWWLAGYMLFGVVGTILAAAIVLFDLGFRS